MQKLSKGENGNNMKFNFAKFKKTNNIYLPAAILIGILIVVNFLSYQIFYRLDLTENKDYSISPATKNIAANVDDVINIKAYFSSELPSQLVNLRQEVSDILEEYANYSKGKIKVEFIDPKQNSDTEQQVGALGIPQLQFNVLEKDKYQVVTGYLGMQIKYGDKSEVIQVIDSTKNLEYQVTTAIKKLTSKTQPVVAFWQNNGAVDPTKEMTEAYKSLSAIYDLRTVDFAKDKKIDDAINTLIIAGPTEKFTDGELKAIDAFVMRGGSLLVMAEGVKISDSFTADKNDLGLNKILEKYGVKLNNDLVLDISSGIATFTQGYIRFALSYPMWPKVVKEGFDQNNAAVAKLESLILPWASSLNILDDKKDGLNISYLAKTTNSAWLETDSFNLNPQTITKPASTSQYDLALFLSGNFSSAFGQSSTAPARLAVVGNSNFIKDSFLQSSPDNLLFFQNLVDSLTLDQDLINIRSKGITDRPLKEISDGTKMFIRYANIFSLTILVIAFGVIRYFLRRRSTSSDKK